MRKIQWLNDGDQAEDHASSILINSYVIKKHWHEK